MGKGAIVALLDSSFLPGLKAFAYSARNAFRDRDEAFVVLTHDQKVADDPFVRNFADDVIMIDEIYRKRISEVRRDKVSSKLAHAEFGKFTFLKFLIFQNLGYDYHIFVDVDMLCLDSDFRFSMIRQDADYAAAPTLGPKALGLESWKSRNLDGAALENVVARIRSISRKKYKVNRSFNSGVSFIQGDLIGDESVNALIELSSREAFKLEQTAVRQYIEGRDLSFVSLPIWINFPLLPCYAIGQDNIGAIWKDIKILHYNQSPKPWQKDSGRDWLDEIWHSTFREGHDWIDGIERGEAMSRRSGP